MSELRTYESFEIVWSRCDSNGSYESRWTGYRSAAEAQAAIDAGGDPGRIVRTTWCVEVPADKAHLYMPGI